MDKDISYAAKLIAKCLLFVERQLKRRRHKSSMASRDESLHQTATNSAIYEASSGNGSYMVDLKSVRQNDTSVEFEKGDMCNENKVFNGPESGRPKKSLFEITNVENTGNRGDGGGIDLEDAELDETLIDLHDTNSPFEAKDGIWDDSTVEELTRDKNPSGNSNGSEVSHTPASAVGLPSRFKIVKVARAEPYKRGRWACQEFMDTTSESKLPDRNVSDAKIASGNTNTYSLAHENRDNSGQSTFPTKQERKDVEQKIVSDSTQNGSDIKHSDNNSENTSETRGGVATASNQSLIESLEAQAENLAHFVEG